MDGSASRKTKPNAHEIQAQAISKLLANPEKEIKIPDALRERSIRAPRDVMKNVSGSSAGAGSGEFHVYKQQRRREYERIQLMEEQARKVADQEEFDRKRAQLEQQSESKTDKNRAKREKKRLAALKAKAAVSGKSDKAATTTTRTTTSAMTSNTNGLSTSSADGLNDSGKRQRLHNDEVDRIQFKKRAQDSDDDPDSDTIGPS